MNFFSTRFETIANFFSYQEFPTTWWAGVFSWTYWTDNFLPASSPYTLFFLVVTAATIAGLLTWQKKLKKLRAEMPVNAYELPINHIPSIITLIVVMAISYLFFRSQQIAYFSSRLTILITVAIVIIWTGYLINHLRRRALSERQQYLEKERFFRYLPKKKHDN